MNKLYLSIFLSSLIILMTFFSGCFGEVPEIPTDYCGDSKCNNNETFETCPQDCIENPNFIEDSTYPLSMFAGTEFNCNSSRLRGDIDNDSEITAKDSNIMAYMYAGKLDKPTDLCCVDLTLEKKFTNIDIIAAKQIAAGVRTSAGTCAMPQKSKQIANCNNYANGEKRFRGDIDSDNRLNSNDSTLLLDIISGNVLHQEEICCMDLDNDSSITTSDLAILQQRIQAGQSPGERCGSTTLKVQVIDSTKLGALNDVQRGIEATVNVFSSTGKKLITTQETDLAGNATITLTVGDYLVQVSAQGFFDSELEKVSVKENSKNSTTILLEKVVSNGPAGLVVQEGSTTAVFPSSIGTVQKNQKIIITLFGENFKPNMIVLLDEKPLSAYPQTAKVKTINSNKIEIEFTVNDTFYSLFPGAGLIYSNYVGEIDDVKYVEGFYKFSGSRPIFFKKFDEYSGEHYFRVLRPEDISEKGEQVSAKGFLGIFPCLKDCDDYGKAKGKMKDDGTCPDAKDKYRIDKPVDACPAAEDNKAPYEPYRQEMKYAEVPDFPNKCIYLGDVTIKQKKECGYSVIKENGVSKLVGQSYTIYKKMTYNENALLILYTDACTGLLPLLMAIPIPGLSAPCVPMLINSLGEKLSITIIPLYDYAEEWNESFGTCPLLDENPMTGETSNYSYSYSSHFDHKKNGFRSMVELINKKPEEKKFYLENYILREIQRDTYDLSEAQNVTQTADPTWHGKDAVGCTLVWMDHSTVDSSFTKFAEPANSLPPTKFEEYKNYNASATSCDEPHCERSTLMCKSSVFTQENWILKSGYTDLATNTPLDRGSIHCGTTVSYELDKSNCPYSIKDTKIFGDATCPKQSPSSTGIN